MAELKLSLAGPVTLVSGEGHRLTPVSMKGRGLLALLGVAPEMKLARAKAQDKLWSDRAPEQGSASLRQTLSEIRRALGPYKDVLLSGPGWIGLDDSVVEVVTRPETGAGALTVEFAEDLVINDPEFEDWLLVQRNYYADLWASAPERAGRTGVSLSTTADAPEQAVLITVEGAGRSDLEGFTSATLRDAAERASDFMPLEILGDRAMLADRVAALELNGLALGPPDAFILHVSLLRAQAHRQIWSKTFNVARETVVNDLRRISAEITLALLHAASEPLDVVGAPVAVSFPDVFSFSRDRLFRAETQLAKGPAAPSRLAMRAYIRNTLLLERMVDDPDTTREEATELARRALEMAPHSANVLAVAALIAARNRNFEMAVDLSERATRSDPSNPLARNSKSFALSFTGRYEDAHAEAVAARDEPITAFNPATWAIGCAVTAIRIGKFEEALRYSAIAHGYAPDFRPPLRFLGALHFHAGNEADAVEAFTKLRRLEPDFSLELMADADYPVATLRAAQLLRVTEAKII